jgi:hypothetical protein
MGLKHSPNPVMNMLAPVTAGAKCVKSVYPTTGCIPIAAEKPAAPDKHNTCHKLREGVPHHTQNNTAIPHVAIPPPKPLRSCAISGISLGFIACNSPGVIPMNLKSCGTNTVVIPTTIIVSPPIIIPVAVASNKARPIPNGDVHRTLTDGLKREEIFAGLGMMR